MRKQRLTPHDAAREELMTELKKAQNALDSAYSVFENVTDPDLIDCAIYQINAIQLRYKYLLECARQYAPVGADSDTEAVLTVSSAAAETGIYKYSELLYD